MTDQERSYSSLTNKELVDLVAERFTDVSKSSIGYKAYSDYMFSQVYAQSILAKLTESKKVQGSIKVVGGEFFVGIGPPNDPYPKGLGISNDMARATWIALLKGQDHLEREEKEDGESGTG